MDLRIFYIWMMVKVSQASTKEASAESSSSSELCDAALDSGLDGQTKRDKKGEQWFKRLDERREYPNQKADLADYE